MRAYRSKSRRNRDPSRRRSGRRSRDRRLKSPPYRSARSGRRDDSRKRDDPLRGARRGSPRGKRYSGRRDSRERRRSRTRSRDGGRVQQRSRSAAARSNKAPAKAADSEDENEKPKPLFLLVHTNECGKLIGQKASGIECLKLHIAASIKEMDPKAQVSDRMAIQAQTNKDKNPETHERYLRIDGLQEKFHFIAVSEILILVEKCRDQAGKHLTRKKHCTGAAESKTIELIIGYRDTGSLLSYSGTGGEGIPELILELTSKLKEDTDYEIEPNTIRTLFHDDGGVARPTDNTYRRMKIYGISNEYRKNVIEFFKPLVNFLECPIEGHIQGEVESIAKMDRLELEKIGSMEKQEGEEDESMMVDSSKTVMTDGGQPLPRPPRPQLADAPLTEPDQGRPVVAAGFLTKEHIEIPAGAVGAVIGPKGSIVADICKRSGLKIAIDQSPQTVPKGMAKVMISGDSECIEWGIEMINGLVQRWRNQFGGGAGGGGGAPVNPMSGVGPPPFLPPPPQMPPMMPPMMAGMGMPPAPAMMGMGMPGMMGMGMPPMMNGMGSGVTPPPRPDMSFPPSRPSIDMGMMKGKGKGGKEHIIIKQAPPPGEQTNELLKSQDTKVKEEDREQLQKIVNYDDL